MVTSSTHSSANRIPVFTRFWLGSVLPALALALLIALVVTTGRGRQEAPMVLFFASLFAVPLVVLLNCWVNWRLRLRLVASASVLPAIVGIGSVLFVHGAGRWQEAGMLILLPFLAVPMRGIGVMTALWAISIAGLLLAARRRVSGSATP
jgi:hypothetical protein